MKNEKWDRIIEEARSFSEPYFVPYLFSSGKYGILCTNASCSYEYDDDRYLTAICDSEEEALRKLHELSQKRPELINRRTIDEEDFAKLSLLLIAESSANGTSFRTRSKERDSSIESSCEISNRYYVPYLDRSGTYSILQTTLSSDYDYDHDRYLSARCATEEEALLELYGLFRMHPELVNQNNIDEKDFAKMSLLIIRGNSE